MEATAGRLGVESGAHPPRDPALLVAAILRAHRAVRDLPATHQSLSAVGHPGGS
jgi:hypothetical protein